jgi:putative methyltransferase (TIGR04325 family)
MKKLLKMLLPRSLRRGLAERHSNSWRGDFASWNEALQNCSGYNEKNIFEKVKGAVLKVKAGEALYEQDGVLFQEESYSWPLLSGLMLAAANNKGALTVMDFGGSLGSTYFQHRKFIELLPFVQWNIIEQPRFVEFGLSQLQNNQLQFHLSPELCIEKNGKPEVLLISTTLPYLEDPLKSLKSLMKLQLPYLIVDNTVFNVESKDRLTVQTVPKTIYDASYPCWFLNYKKVLWEVNQDYDIISQHFNTHVIELDGVMIRFRGFFAKIKER